jgi:hypothetical protein
LKKRESRPKFFRKNDGKIGTRLKIRFQIRKHMQLAQIFQIGIARMDFRGISRANFGEIWNEGGQEAAGGQKTSSRCREILEKALLKKTGF